MTGSWRDILENASASLSIGLNRGRPSQVQYPPSTQGMRRRSPKPSYSSAEARDLLERELEAISARPLHDRPAFADGRQAVNPRARPLGNLPAPLHHEQTVQTVDQRAGPLEDRPASADSRQVAKQRTVPRTSLMAALNAATPAALEKSTPSIILPKRLPRRGFLVISVSAAIVGLSALALLNRGGRGAGASLNRQAAPVPVSAGALVSIPLPSRRPSNLRGEQSRARGSSGNAGN
jgi:hypothetical protein